MKLFISYAHKDFDNLQPIIVHLQDAGHEVWYDTQLKAGQKWQAQLEQQISECDVFVYMMTPNSAWNVSEWCHWEFVTAVEHDKPVLPVLLKAVEMPVVLQELQYADLTKGIETEKIIKLLADLEALHVKKTEDIPIKLEPSGKPPRVGEVNQTITATDSAQVTSIGQQNIGNQTNIENQTIGEKQRNWNSAYIVSLIVAIVGVIFAIIATLPEPQRDNILYLVGLVPASATPTSVPTPSRTLTPSKIPTITPTPLEGTPFAEGDVGIVVADFEAYGEEDEARALVVNIIFALEEEGFPYIYINHQLSGRDEAQQIANLYNATIVMWGERQDSGVRVFFEIRPRDEREVYTIVDTISVPSDIENFSTYLFDGLDTRYIANFTIGQLHYTDKEYETAWDYFYKALQYIPEGREMDVGAAKLYHYLGYTQGQIGEQEDRLQYYTKAIEIDPNQIISYVGRGVVKANIGDLEGAINDYNIAISIDPVEAYIYDNRGLTKAQLGDYNGAIADYDQAIAIDLEFVKSYINRGSAKYNLGSYEDAIDDYNLAINLDPENALAYHARGSAKYALGDDQGAINDYTIAIELNPNDAIAYNYRGESRENMGNIEGAIVDYTHAIEIDDDYVLAYENRGEAKQLLGNYEDAILDFSQAITLEPEDVELYVDRGIAKHKMLNFEGAIEDYTRAIEIDPEYEDAYNNRGSAKSSSGDYEGAISDFNRAIELDAESGFAYRGRGQAKAALGDLTAAIEDYTVAIGLDPDDALAYAYRASAKYQFVNPIDKNGAIADWYKAIELDGTLVNAYNDLAMRLDNSSEALRLLNKALTIDSSSTLILGNRAEIYRRLGQFEEALADIDTLMNINSQETWIYDKRASIWRSMGNYANAINDYKTAIELDTRWSFLYQRLADVYYDSGQYSDAYYYYSYYLDLFGENNGPDWVMERIAELETLVSDDD